MKQDAALIRHLKKALPVVRSAALEASPFLKRKFGKVKKLSIKENAGLVTEADHGSEKIILKILKKKFPKDHFTAEETGHSTHKSSSSFRWHIDPLDGTTNFVHGFPFFCISIGLVFEDRDFVLGVIHQPSTGDTFTGYKAGGAFKNGKRISVSKVPEVSQALLTTGFSYRREEHLAKEMQTFAKITHKSRGIRRTGSAALDLTFIATGQFDGFWERGLSSWDVAAGLALISEAGGKFSTFSGTPFRILESEELVASNGLIHKEMISIFNRSSLTRLENRLNEPLSEL